MSKFKNTDLLLSTDILRSSMLSMDYKAFMEYCLNSWRDKKNDYDDYSKEKYESFCDNPLFYFGTLDKKNLAATLQGIINFYDDQLKKITIKNIDNLPVHDLGLVEYYLSDQNKNYTIVNEILGKLTTDPVIQQVYDINDPYKKDQEFKGGF